MSCCKSADFLTFWLASCSPKFLESLSVCIVSYRVSYNHKLDLTIRSSATTFVIFRSCPIYNGQNPNIFVKGATLHGSFCLLKNGANHSEAAEAQELTAGVWLFSCKNIELTNQTNVQCAISFNSFNNMLSISTLSYLLCHNYIIFKTRINICNQQNVNVNVNVLDISSTHLCET